MSFMESILIIVFFFAIAFVALGLIYKSIKIIICTVILATLVFSFSGYITSDPNDNNTVNEVSDINEYEELADEYSIVILEIIESANDAIESNDPVLAKEVIEKAQNTINEINTIIDNIEIENISSNDKNIIIPIYKGFISSLERAVEFMRDIN